MKQSDFQAYFDEAMAKLAEAVGDDPLVFLEDKPRWLFASDEPAGTCAR